MAHDCKYSRDFRPAVTFPCTMWSALLSTACVYEHNNATLSVLRLHTYHTHVAIFYIGSSGVNTRSELDGYLVTCLSMNDSTGFQE